MKNELTALKAHPGLYVVNDIAGKLVGYLEHGSSMIRDGNGKPVMLRTGKDPETLRLADRASDWMTGRSVQMDLAPSDVTTAAAQAEFGIPALECIADRVSPVKFVNSFRGVFYGENAADLVKPVAAEGSSAGGATPTIEPGVTPTNFTTVGHSLAAMIPRRVSNNADFDLKLRTTRRIVEALRLSREIRLAALLTTSGNWAAANVVAAGAKWNGGSSANPLADLVAARATSYLPTNAIILAEDVEQPYFQNANSTAIRDYVQAGGQLPTPIVGRARVMSGGSLKYVWSTGATTNTPLVRIGDPDDALTTTRTLRWLGDDGVKDGERKGGMLVREFYDAGNDADWIVVTHDDVELFVNSQIGALITGVLA